MIHAIDTSGLGMWFQADIARVLDGIDAAIAAPLALVPSDNASRRAYAAGAAAFRDATCTAFGLAFIAPQRESTRELMP